jgi:hypothetical protein
MPRFLLRHSEWPVMMIAMNVAIGSDDNGHGRLLRWHLAYGLIVPRIETIRKDRM